MLNKMWNKMCQNPVISTVLATLLTTIILAFIKQVREYAVLKITSTLSYMTKTREIPNWEYWLFWLFVCMLVLLIVKYLLWKHPKKLEIIKATYGSFDNPIDVTQTVIHHKNNNTVKFMVRNSIFGNADPAQGIVKVLTVDYTVNGKYRQKKTIEKKIFRIP